MQEHRSGTHYRRLFVMSALSFASMYILMYAMVDNWGHAWANLNKAYMAGLMTAPMVVFELLLMRSMYQNARWNAALLGVSAVAGIACFVLIRGQMGITDRQFLRSMIPHHSSAILMCTEAPIQERAIRELCDEIVASQRSEIAQMKALLDE